MCSIKDSQGFLNDNSCNRAWNVIQAFSVMILFPIFATMVRELGSGSQTHLRIFKVNIMSLEIIIEVNLRNLDIQRNVFDARNMEVSANLVESWVWTCVAFHSWSFWSPKGKLHDSDISEVPRSIGDRFNKPCTSKCRLYKICFRTSKSHANFSVFSPFFPRNLFCNSSWASLAASARL